MTLAHYSCTYPLACSYVPNDKLGMSVSIPHDVISIWDLSETIPGLHSQTVPLHNQRIQFLFSIPWWKLEFKLGMPRHCSGTNHDFLSVGVQKKGIYPCSNTSGGVPSAEVQWRKSMSNSHLAHTKEQISSNKPWTCEAKTDEFMTYRHDMRQRYVPWRVARGGGACFKRHKNVHCVRWRKNKQDDTPDVHAKT